MDKKIILIFIVICLVSVSIVFAETNEFDNYNSEIINNGSSEIFGNLILALQQYVDGIWALKEVMVEQEVNIPAQSIVNIANYWNSQNISLDSEGDYRIYGSFAVPEEELIENTWDFVVNRSLESGEEVVGCGILDQPDTVYILQDNIINTDILTTSCINITAPNITLNCNGNSIRSTFDVKGIYTNQINTIIMNCDVDTTSNTGYAGIKLENAHNSLVINNKINNNFWGLSLFYTDDSRVENNIMNNNSRYGLIIQGGDNNQVINNTANNNSRYGFYISSYSDSDSHDNILINNIAQYNGLAGLRLGESFGVQNFNNLLSGNKFCFNLEDDMKCRDEDIISEFTNNSCNINTDCGWVCTPCEKTGLISYWNFASGAEDKQELNHGSLVGDAEIIEYSEREHVLSLDGDGDYVIVPNSDSLDITEEITISAWVNRNEIGITHRVVSKRDQNSGYDLQILGGIGANANKLQFNFGDGTNIIAQTSSTPTVLIGWHHIAVSYDKENIKFYVNGALIDVVPETNNLASTPDDLWIGRFEDSDHVEGTSYFDGSIDDVQIYNIALTAEEIEDLYNEQKVEELIPLVNQKNMSQYSNKQAFLISDKNWKDILPLVPVAVWTNEINEVEQHPLLIFHEEEFSDKTLELSKKEFIKNTGLYVSWNFKDTLLAEGDVESEEFTIVFNLDDDMYYKMSKGIPRGDLNLTGVKIDSQGFKEIQYNVFFNGYELANSYNINYQGGNNYLLQGAFWGQEQSMLIRGENTLTLRRNGGNVLITNYSLFIPYFATDGINDDCIYNPGQYDIYDLCIRDVQLNQDTANPDDEITYSIIVENICNDVIDLSGNETVFQGKFFAPESLGELYKSPYELIFSHLDTIIPSVSLQPGESTEFEIKLIYNKSENLPDYAFDADSIIYFMQQYSPEKVSIIGNTPQELDNLLIAQPELGAGLTENQITKISPENYLNYWSNFKNIVYVEDNYELALLASTYASLINAPLIIQGTDLDSEQIFSNKSITCIGGVNPSNSICSENYNLEELQIKYLDKTNTTKLVLVNPDDLEIRTFEEYETDKGGSIVNLYTRDSLSAPILASAKHELILPIKSQDYLEIDDYFTSKLNEYYEIPLREEKICKAGEICSRGFEKEILNLSVAENSISFDLTIDMSPDLTAQMQWPGNKKAILNEVNLIPIEIINNGFGIAKNVSAYLYEINEIGDFILIDNISLDDMNGGENIKKNLSWLPLEERGYQLKLLVECINDSNLNDNEYWEWINAGLLGPDINVYSYLTNVPKIGEQTQIVIFTTNIGTEDVENINITIYDNEQIIHESNIFYLEAGYSDKSYLDWVPTEGEHKIKVVVNLTNDINLNDNIYENTYIIYPLIEINFNITNSSNEPVERLLRLSYDENEPSESYMVSGPTTIELIESNTNIWLGKMSETEDFFIYTSFYNSRLNLNMNAVSDYFEKEINGVDFVLHTIYANQPDWDYDENKLIYFAYENYQRLNIQDINLVTLYSCVDWDFINQECISGWVDIGYDEKYFKRDSLGISKQTSGKIQAFALGESIIPSSRPAFIKTPELSDSDRFLNSIRESIHISPPEEAGILRDLEISFGGGFFNCDSETTDSKYYINDQLVKTQNTYCRELSEISLNLGSTIGSGNFNYLINSNKLNITLVFNGSVYLNDKYGLMQLRDWGSWDTLISCDSLNDSCAPQTESLQIENYFSDKTSYFNFSGLDTNKSYYVFVNVIGEDIENISVYFNNDFKGAIKNIYSSKNKKAFKISGDDLNNDLEVKLVPTPRKYEGDPKYSAKVVVKQILDLPYYLTIISNPDAIPMARKAINGGCSHAGTVEADGRIYGSLDNYEFIDIPTGRITGLTSSDVSGYIARDLFFDELPKNKDALLVIREDYQSEIYEICEELGVYEAGGDCGSNGTALEEYARRYFWTDEIRNEFDNEFFFSGHDEVSFNRDEIYEDYSQVYLNLFDDHGNTNTFAEMMDSNYLMENNIYLKPSLVLGLACSTCKYYSQGDLFCMQGMRRGALAQQGAVDVSYWHQEFDNILTGTIIENKTIGRAYLEARNEDYAEGHYNFCSSLEGDPYYALLGDPTWRPKWW